MDEAATKRRVLVVDDDSLLRRLLGAMMTKMGIEHTLVAHGDDAVAAVTEQQFDIALVDERLAGETGAEVSARLREACGKASLRIVGVSGGRLGPGPGTGHYDGLDAKPSRPEQLEELLDRWT